MWPWNNQGIASPNLNVTPQQRQYFSGDAEIFEPDANLMGQVPSYTPHTDYSNYEDLIQNPEYMPNSLQNLERFADNRFEDLDFQPGYNFKNAPNKVTNLKEAWQNRNYLNNPNRGFNFPNIGITGILKSIKDQFEYKGATEPAWDPQTGQMISAEEQDKQNALGGYYSAAARHDRRQNKRVTDMLARKAANKNFSQTNLERLQNLGYGDKTVVTDTVTDVTRPGGGGNQMAMSQMADRGRARGRGETGQIAGGHHFAQGGRIGYALAGPVGVEQETDFIQGPQGGEEFQETVVEGEEQPSREQLEALAMHIFQLPLDDLDDQQLVVVYQAAMQGEPMEEAVQEEDVQFAANGGLAGLL